MRRPSLLNLLNALARVSKSRQEIDQATIPSSRSHAIGTNEAGEVHLRVVGAVGFLDKNGVIHDVQHKKIVEAVSKAVTRACPSWCPSRRAIPGLLIPLSFAPIKW